MSLQNEGQQFYCVIWYETVGSVQSANHSCDLQTPIHLCRIPYVLINKGSEEKKSLFIVRFIDTRNGQNTS